MMQFTHDTKAQRVMIRRGRAATAVAEELERAGATGVMTIGSARSQHVLDALSPRVVWTEVVQHVPAELAARATAAAVGAGVDAVVAVGGGSAIGLAKAIALQHSVPVLAVPTTYAGSEATDVWGLTDADGKRTGVDARVLPRVVVYDPELVRDLPVELAVASGLNAVAHCMDTMWAPRADPINAAQAVEALGALRRGLLALQTDSSDLEACAHMQYGCYVAGVAFASAGAAMHHKICHVLGGSFGLPHAATHAVVLPYVLAWNEPAAPEAAHRIAAALDASSATHGLSRLRAALAAPRSLRELGLQEHDVARAAAGALRAIPDSNPRPVDEPSLTRLLQAAWAGDEPEVEW